MNNGQPPYNPYSQQGSFQSGNYPQGQGQPMQGYQQGQPPVPGYQQQGYQPAGYPQPMPGYQQQSYPSPSPQQNYPYQNYQPQTYQQQAHQPQTWQQQTWQPYGQEPQQAYQPYAQQPAQYPQYNQQGQPVMPQQGYSGYVSQPAKPKKQGVPVDVIAKALLFGVLPVLFVLGLVLGSTALKWVFLAAAAAGIIGMWLTDVIAPNLRLTLSLVYGALAVVALVSALNGGAPDAKNPASDSYSSPGSQQQSQSGAPAGGYSDGSLQWTSTDVPTAEPTSTPDPTAADGAAMEQLTSFLYFWSVNNDENMVALTAPSWRSSVQEPRKELFKILANRIPDQDYEIDMSGTDNDTQRTAKVKVTIDKNNNRAKERYSFKIIMLKEDGAWYVDPRSLASHDKETATPATVNTTPTQPPYTTGSPNMVLYYNPDGGSYYHLDPNCSEVGKKYRPLQGTFLYPELANEPYSLLDECIVCGAPVLE